MSRKASLVPSQFDAAAFDLDGVITDTARIHFQAWQQTFDALFEGLSRRTGVSIPPFTLEDYHKYIDGPQPFKLPSFCFRVRRSAFERMLGQGDSWGFTRFPGFARKPLRAKWVTGAWGG